MTNKPWIHETLDCFYVLLFLNVELFFREVTENNKFSFSYLTEADPGGVDPEPTFKKKPKSGFDRQEKSDPHSQAFLQGIKNDTVIRSYFFSGSKNRL